MISKKLLLILSMTSFINADNEIEQSTTLVVYQDPKPVKIEDLVGKVLNNSMNKPNIEGNTKKIISDLSAILVAGCGYLLSNRFFPNLPAIGSNDMSKLTASILTAYVSFRLSNSGLTKLFQKINWDPRDLAVAEILLDTIKTGTPVTSDYAQLQDLFNGIIPAEAQTKGPLSMSREQKIKLSRCIRGFLEALKMHKKLSLDSQNCNA